MNGRILGNDLSPPVSGTMLRVEIEVKRHYPTAQTSRDGFSTQGGTKVSCADGIATISLFNLEKSGIRTRDTLPTNTEKY
jgi:hypothetical protein